VRLTAPLAIALLAATACAHPKPTPGSWATSPDSAKATTKTPARTKVAADAATGTDAAPAGADPRVGLKPGLYDAGTAIWNMRVVSETRTSEKFAKAWNSDLTFTGHYVIQGSFSGYQIWDIADPFHPKLTTGYYCPESQSDVSVYKNLLIVSGEDVSSRLDCGSEGVKDTVSSARLRGARIFDISDIKNPRNVANVQTCRGSHTNTLLVDPNDSSNIYIYISGSAPVRSGKELAGCSASGDDSTSSLFRIEVIKIPVAHPEQAAVVSQPRIFQHLYAPVTHGETKQDSIAGAQAGAEARAKGKFTVTIRGETIVVPDSYADNFLKQAVAERGGTGAPTHADSVKLQQDLPGIVAKMVGPDPIPGQSPGPTQCHDITVYPAIGLAGGACEGYGMLLNIQDPIHPVRIAAVADSNFSYWHSATFNNNGTTVLFSDEWGGGTQPKCRPTDKPEWGADAIFTIEPDHQLKFRSYYKLPAPQTQYENCVAHDGALIPIPGRDVMVQGWYQGGISVFDFTDPAHPQEIAYFDRGPVDGTKLVTGGSWSAYWYNGLIVSSEIARGLDIFALTPSRYLTENEIDAASTVRLPEFNAQGQPRYVWPPSFPLVRAYFDQIIRVKGLDDVEITEIRGALAAAEHTSGTRRRDALNRIASRLDRDTAIATDVPKVKTMAGAVRDLAAAAQTN
jgi:hypothetical protein